MHFLTISLRKDWARVRRDPMSFAVALGIPLVLAVLMSLVFGRDPAMPHGRLLVADEDNSMASNRMLDAFHGGSLNRILDVEKVDAANGRARVDRGEVSAFLRVPKGLQQAFLLNQPFRVELFTNPSEQLVPQIIQDGLTMTMEAMFYVRRGVPPPSTPGSGAIAIDLQVERPRRRSVSFAAAFLPSMIFMGLLFIASSLATDIWRERMLGTLRRLASSPVPMSAYLAARVVFVALMYLIVALVAMAAAQGLSGMPVSNLPAAVLWMTFVGTVFYLFFLCIALQASTMRGASVLANLVIFPLAMLGGCFFPFEWMPPWMVRIGKLTPNGFALTGFKTILDGSATASSLTRAATALTIVAAVAYLLSLRRLKVAA